jgi:hypothetical protein
MDAQNLLNIVGCLFLLMFGIQVLTTIRSHQRFSIAAVRQMTQVSMGGGKALLLFGGVLGLASALLQPVLSDWIPPLPPLMMIGVSLLALNGACLPPTFLLLAASQTGGFSFANDVQLSVAPLKMVHLLDSFQAGAIVGDALHQSEYRVSSNWQRAVRTLSRISPVIIVDVRELTPNVYREIVRLVETGLHSRVFLIAEKAQAPTDVARLCHQFGVRICVVTPELLEAALGRVGWTVLFRSVGNVFRFLELKMLNIAATHSR